MSESDPIVGFNKAGVLGQIREAQTPDDLAAAFKALFFCEHTEEQVRAGFNKAADMGRAATLAEVRRVVEECTDWDWRAGILARLEKL